MQGFRGIFVFLFLMSGIINVLALTGSFYMLQIYDRALTSGSMPTLRRSLPWRSGSTCSRACFDVIRSQVLVRVGARLDRKLAPLAHRVAIDMPRFGFSTRRRWSAAATSIRCAAFSAARGRSRCSTCPGCRSISSSSISCTPMLGALTFGGAFVLTLLTIATELMTRRLSAPRTRRPIARNAIADSNARNAEILKAMGFAGRAVARFNKANREHLMLQTRANDISGTFGAISRVLRMILQSAMLGLGAYLTIQGELSAGAIIAASVASSRALAPVDLAIGNWKGVVAARTAFQPAARKRWWHSPGGRADGTAGADNRRSRSRRSPSPRPVRAACC